MNSETAEYFRVLEVSPGASLDEVKHARSLLLRAWHPDRFPNDAEAI